MMLAGVLSTSVARADETNSAPAVASVTPPDVVRLKDGGMVRGTIIEKRVDDAVVIQTALGETHEIPWDEISWAGVAAEMPSAQKKSPPRRSPPKSQSIVQLRSNDREPLDFHIRSGELAIVGRSYVVPATVAGRATTYRPLCTAPCEVMLLPGDYRFAVSQADGSVVELRHSMHIPAGRAELTASYESYAGMRAAGWVVMVASSIVGLGLIFSSRVEDCSTGICYSAVDKSKLTLGLGIGVGGPLLGLLMALKADSASGDVIP